MKFVYDCAECGSHGTISFKETDQFTKTDIAYCPFCSGDISQEEEYDDEN